MWGNVGEGLPDSLEVGAARLWRLQWVVCADLGMRLGLGLEERKARDLHLANLLS